MAKKDSIYFSEFVKMSEFSCEASGKLQKFLSEFNPDKLPEQLISMHKIEHAEDQIKHDIIARLVKEFVPPIDREDILELANEMDNITDKIEDILIRMYMYNVRSLRPGVIEITEVIVKCCEALAEAVSELPKFHKSSVLRQKIIDINTLEEEGDKIYMDAVRKLYLQCTDPIEISSWSKLFDLFEECCDACEHVANFLESVVMKNS